MSILMDNNVLQAAEEKVLGGLTPQMREYCDRVVVAGLKASLKDGPNGIMGSLKNSKDPIIDSAKGAINLTLMLRKHSRNTMPEGALVPGALILMFKALDTIDKAGIAKIGAAELDKATHVFTNYLFTVFKITPQKLNFIADKVHGVMGDHAQMDMVSRKAGTVRDPRASIPTGVTGPVPGAEEK